MPQGIQFTLNKRQTSRAIRLYTKKEWTVDELALEFECSPSAMRKFLIRNEVEMRRRGPRAAAA
jgi:transposase-like protein